MTIKDLEEKNNILMKRRELYFILLHPGEPTPTRQAIKNKLAAKYAVPLDLVLIYKLDPEFGRGSTKCFVHIYDSKENVDKLVPKHIIKRNQKNSEGDSNIS